MILTTCTRVPSKVINSCSFFTTTVRVRCTCTAVHCTVYTYTTCIQKIEQHSCTVHYYEKVSKLLFDKYSSPTRTCIKDIILPKTKGYHTVLLPKTKGK